MTDNIKISIVTATLNCSQTLSHCLASIHNQKYTNWEHIVIDGLSTDGTIDIINRYSDKIAIFKSERDQGIYDAFNKGMSLATGDVIGFLNADDFYASDRALEKIANAFKDSNVSAVYSDLRVVKKEDSFVTARYWRSNTYKPIYLQLGWMPPHPTLYVRSDLYSKIGGFDFTFNLSADYLSILKIFSKPDCKTVYIPEALVVQRLGGASNKTLKAQIIKTMEDWTALRRSGFGFLGSYRAIIFKKISRLCQFIH